MSTAWQTFPIEFRGGLISNLSPLQQGINKVGSATILQNYEPAREGGYRKINGYTKFSTTAITGVGPVLAIKVFDESKVIVARSTGTATAYYRGVGTTWTLMATAASIGGRATSDEVNFAGVHKVVFVDGVNYPAVYNGNTNAVTFLTTAPTDVQAATAVKMYKNHVFYAKGSKLTFTAPYNEGDFSVANGAGEIDIGHTITGLVVFRDNLIVFSRNKISQLTGNTVSDFALFPVTDDIGCISGDTIQEVGGDIMYLAPDGLRLLSATDRIGDFALEIASTPIEKDAKAVFTSSDVYNSLVIRGKAQYRLFTYIEADSEKDHRGLIATKFSDQGASSIAWSTLKGIKVHVSDSKYTESGERICFANADGYVYLMDVGSSFDGSNISSIYESPYMPVTDPQIRKTFYRLTLYVTPTGAFDITCGVKYDFNRVNGVNVIQPPSFTVSSSSGGGSVLWGAPGVTWGSFSFSGELDRVYGSAMVGSGKTFALRFDDDTTNPSHTLDAAIVEYVPLDRQ